MSIENCRRQQIRPQKNRRDDGEERCTPCNSLGHCCSCLCGLFGSLTAAGRLNNHARLQQRPHFPGWQYPEQGQAIEGIGPEFRPNRLHNLRDHFIVKYSRQRQDQSPFANRVATNPITMQKGVIDFSLLKVTARQGRNLENFSPVLILNNAENRCTCRCHTGVALNAADREKCEMENHQCHQQLAANASNTTKTYKHNYNYYCYDPVNNVYRLALGPQKGILMEESSLCQCKTRSKIEGDRQDRQNINGENIVGHTHANSYSPSMNSHKEMKNAAKRNEKIKKNIPLQNREYLAHSFTDLPQKAIITF